VQRGRIGETGVVASVTRGTSAARRNVRAFVDSYVEHDLLTYASAISFQVLSAIVPFLLFGVGVLGFLSLESVWRGEIAPEIEPNFSAAAFTVINDVVEKVLGAKHVFWVTAGFVIALWEISGAVRAVMGALNKIYRDATERSWGRRMVVSFALGLAVGACFLGAIAVVVLTPLLYGDAGAVSAAILFVVRWAAAGGLLLLAVAVLLHYAPERHQPLHWVTRGTLLIMGGWIVMSLAFSFYLRDIASYGSIFGSLATVVVLIAYLYASSIIFLAGVQIDALARERG
jgi:membrane protein